MAYGAIPPTETLLYTNMRRRFDFGYISTSAILRWHFRRYDYLGRKLHLLLHSAGYELYETSRMALYDLWNVEASPVRQLYLRTASLRLGKLDLALADLNRSLAFQLPGFAGRSL
jgi:hypothetical protein